MNPRPSESSATHSMTRRDFIKTSSTLTAAGALTATMKPVFAAGSDTIRVGLIGCGNRGTGAAMNCVLSSPGVEVITLGDAFADRVDACLVKLKDNNQGREWSCSREWKHAEHIKVTRDTCFTGLDAYEKVLACDVNLVILAGPPHFRARHLKAAIEAGKNVFMEKPVGVDPATIRSIITSSNLARQKGLAIVAGTQRRHQNSYLEVMQRIRNGDLGELVGGECSWNGGCVRHYGFYHPRQPDWTDMEYQLRNWYFYSWLSGDHIVEQHVHNLDVMNWAMGTPPSEAVGVGGRQWRVEPEFGNIYDHFGIRYQYPKGEIVFSTARQIDGTQPRIDEMIVGTQGKAWSGRIEGPKAWRWDGPNPNPYEQEHADLIRSIREGKPLNEGRRVAEATFTAIIGRMAAYTGQTVRFQWALEESQLKLGPETYALGDAPVPPVASGNEELI